MASSRALLLGLFLALPVAAQEPAPAPVPVPAAAPASFSGAVSVIVHPEVKLDEATPAKIRKYYLKMAPAFPGGVKVATVDFKDGSGLRNTFCDKVLGWSPEEVERYWIERQYQTSDAAPEKLASDAEVIAWVAGHPGGIGFVHKEAVPADGGGVKVVLTVEK